MMRLLRSWRDSLLLLAPQNFKLFALVTLKSTFDTYKVLARAVWYFWMLPIIILFQQLYWGKEAFTAQFKAPLSMPMYLFIGVLYIGFAVWMTVAYCLSTRPSIGQKNRVYFERHGRFILILALVAILLWQFNFWRNRFFPFYYYELTSALALIPALTAFVLPDFVPLLTFFILFFLDSDGSVKQLWNAVVRAVKMTVYNLPLLLVLMMVITLPMLMLAKYATSYQWSGYAWNIGAPLFYMFLLKPLLVNIWTNIYIKKVHEMPELYFNQPK